MLLHRWLVFLVLPSFCITACQRVVDSVPAVESARFAATVERDTAALRTLLHPDLLYIHSNGNEETCDGYINSVAAGRIEYTRFEPLAPTRYRAAGRTVLADGLVQVHGRYEGTPFSVKLRYTSTYLAQARRWKLLRWQSLSVD